MGRAAVVLLVRLGAAALLCSAMRRPAQHSFPPVVRRRRVETDYCVGCALAGAVSTSATHTMFLPLDVLKTKMQSEPSLALRGPVSALRHVVKAEGVGTLCTGVTANAAGYLAQGALKFGLYERGKQELLSAFKKRFGAKSAKRWRVPMWIVSSACAEVVACIALCPMEATKIRLIADATYATGTFSAVSRIIAEEGARALYRGLFPIMCRQVPYTVAKLVGYEMIAQQIGPGMAPGILAGAAAAAISHPGDVVLSRVCGGSRLVRLESCALSVADALAVMKPADFFVGLQPRATMCAAICAGQFLLYERLRPRNKPADDRSAHARENE